MSKYPPALDQLIASLKFLPGVGTKTAERFAFHLIDWPQEALFHISSLLSTLKEQVLHCPKCHCLSSPDGCEFCDSKHRDLSLLCIIANPKDAYSIEETHAYKGLYHVLGSLLSPMDGRSVEQLNLSPLFERFKTLPIREVIIALDSTLEGDATALYLKEKIAEHGTAVSRLAFGIPIGSPLDYVDGTSLLRAFVGRQVF